MTERVWASVTDDPAVVAEQAFEEAAGRDPRKKRDAVVLPDGNVDQLKLLQKTGKKFGFSLTMAPDIIPASEYLWDAAGDPFDAWNDEAERWVRERFLRLLQAMSVN